MFDENFDIFDDTTVLPVEKNNDINLEPKKTHITDCFITDRTRHEAVVPNQTEYTNIKMLDNFTYKTYPFQLDTFQKLALTALHMNNSVLVSAHTSSGKTVIAEYAIAMSLQNKQRVIYTSPIKALSNQKYRELQEEYKDVGLVTGDVTLNPNASCLVMTTEILRNMLYRGSEIMREVKWIIFDEIHYIKEKERGVVWEECIIMASKDVRMVFLSATVPNADEFAEWVSEIKEAVVHVVYTEKRPTPLEHYLAQKGGQMTKILYEKSNSKSSSSFEKKKYKKRIESEDYKKDKKNGKGDDDTNNSNKDTDGCETNNKNATVAKLTTSYFDKDSFELCMKRINGRQRIEEDDVKAVVVNLINQDCLPVIVFSFSRKECEKYALSLSDDFLNESEKETINIIFTNALQNLTEEDRNLPLITNMLPMLLKGIGIHHSGLLPILKEIVEILFQEGLLKILFATETFSIGLNMPARSVVFTNITKFDGEERRLLSSGEYIQMSGRAGRRGIDTKGMVVAMISEAINTKKAEVLFSGLADKLVSAFRLSYNMILNLMRVEGLDTLFLLERSFFHYQSKRGREEMNEKIMKMKEIVRSIKKKENSIHNNQNDNININNMNVDNYMNCESNYLFDENVLNIHKNNLSPSLHLKNINYNFNIQELNSYQIHNILLGYEKIRLKRNQILVKFYEPYLENGRIVNLFIPRKGSPFFIYNAMVKEVTKNEISIVTKINRNLVIKKFRKDCVDKIYDLRLKNLYGLEMMKNKMNCITLQEMILKNERNESVINETMDECEFLNDVLYTLEDKLHNIKANRCFYCGNMLENTDCLSMRCFEENELEAYINGIEEVKDNESNESGEINKKSNECDESSFEEIRRVFVEKMYLKLYDKNLVKLQEYNEIYHMDECKKMIQVLRRLEYCDENNVLTKGRVACEISTGDELLLTEMMFNGDFISLPVEEVVPLLSCIVYPEWDNETSISETNQRNYGLLKSMLEKITMVMKNCGIDIEISSVLKRYSYELMDVVELWVRGYSFTEICNKTNVFEGTIIRCFRRLEELLKQMCSAARNIGNTELENLFAMGISKIKRDIVFASSLYL
ncbi:Exosome RNA helicase MTR4 [Binucleata daphniae]